MNGKKLRYEGLKGCTDYKKAVQIIKDIRGSRLMIIFLLTVCTMRSSTRKHGKLPSRNESEPARDG